MGIGPAKLASQASRMVRIIPFAVCTARSAAPLDWGSPHWGLFEDDVACESPLDSFDKGQNRFFLVIFDDYAAIS